MNGDRPSDHSPTHTGASQPSIASSRKNPSHDQKKKTRDDESNEGTNRTRVLTGREKQTVIIFQNFTQELAEWGDGGVPRNARIR